MKLLLILLSILFLSNADVIAQANIEGTHYTHFQLSSKHDTIDFVIADTNLNDEKPVLLFCQGSQPVPLFFDLDDRTIPVPLSNFDVEKLNRSYHVCVISMPKTPLIVGEDHLNRQYNYVTDTSEQNSYSVSYLRNNYAENYIRRANEVIKFLRKQKWADDNQLVIAGHSQGARVAVGIASTNKKVTHLGLFGYNPHGRMDQLIRQIRENVDEGRYNWEVADSVTQKRIEFYELIQNEDSVSADPQLVSWNSFSKSTEAELVKLKIPIYIAYGSEDIIANDCDLLPLRFIEADKKNYNLVRYPNLEHNFFPLDENGKPDHSSGKWNEVLFGFIDWVEEE